MRAIYTVHAAPYGALSAPPAPSLTASFDFQEGEGRVKSLHLLAATPEGEVTRIWRQLLNFGGAFEITCCSKQAFKGENLSHLQRCAFRNLARKPQKHTVLLRALATLEAGHSQGGRAKHQRG